MFARIKNWLRSLKKIDSKPTIEKESIILNLNPTTKKQQLSNGIIQYTNSILNKPWYPSEKALTLILKKYKNTPNKNKINLSSLDTKEGEAFIYEALFQICDICEETRRFDPVVNETGEIFNELRSKKETDSLLLDIHQRVYQVVQDISRAENQTNIIDIANKKGTENSKRWMYWQQIAERLYRGKDGNHKRIYELWDISMQELSNLHRDIEALNHLLGDLINCDKKNLPSIAQALQFHSDTIMKAGTLEKMTQPPQNLIRDDIPDDVNKWYTQWRTMRNAKGARDRDVLNKLFKRFP